jgi:hypothetical protein
MYGTNTALESALIEHPELSDHAIAEALDVSHYSVRRRRMRLESAGLIAPATSRLCRDGRMLSVLRIGTRRTMAIAGYPSPVVASLE